MEFHATNKIPSERWIKVYNKVGQRTRLDVKKKQVGRNSSKGKVFRETQYCKAVWNWGYGFRVIFAREIWLSDNACQRQWHGGMLPLELRACKISNALPLVIEVAGVRSLDIGFQHYAQLIELRDNRKTLGLTPEWNLAVN